jgi:hypothetical protein
MGEDDGSLLPKAYDIARTKDKGDAIQRTDG